MVERDMGFDYVFIFQDFDTGPFGFVDIGLTTSRQKWKNTGHISENQVRGCVYKFSNEITFKERKKSQKNTQKSGLKLYNSFSSSTVCLHFL
jgi:hypothetical protein